MGNKSTGQVDSPDSKLAKRKERTVHADPVRTTIKGAIEYLERLLPKITGNKLIIRYLFAVSGIMRFRVNWFADSGITRTDFLRVVKRGSGFKLVGDHAYGLQVDRDPVVAAGQK